MANDFLEPRCTELLIHSYFNIIKREMIDMVPKSISLTLVQHSKDLVQKELLQELYKPDVLEDLMKESHIVVERRAEVVKMLNALNKAEEYVSLFQTYWFKHMLTTSCDFAGLWRMSRLGKCALGGRHLDTHYPALLCKRLEFPWVSLSYILCCGSYY